MCVSARQLGLITFDQALNEARLTRNQVRHVVESGRWERVGVGLFAVAGTPRTYERDVLAACLACGPDASACRATAARLHDVGRPYFGDAGIEVMVAKSATRRRAATLGATVRQTRHADLVDREWLGPIPVTTGARLIVDLLDRVPLDVLFALADDVLWKLRDPRVLRQTWERVGGGRHRRTLEAVLVPWAPGRKVGSPKEMTLSRVLQAHGLPRPAVQLPVRIPGRAHPRHLDLAYPDERVAPEYDGRRDHGPRQWESDAAREHELAGVGWLRLPAGRLDLVEPGASAYCDMVRAALAARRRAPATSRP